MPRAADHWDKYVGEFHQQRPGITESVLARSHDRSGVGPYEFVNKSLPGGSTVDIACGSDPAFVEPRPGSVRVGVDRSMAELGQARAAGRGPVVAADVASMPLRTGRFDSAVCAMALMVVNDPAALLSEAHRILTPGAELRLLLPARGPLGAADILRYAALLAALGRTSLPFPSQSAASDPEALLALSGFDVVSSQRHRFRYPLAHEQDARLLADSLYVHGVPARRQRLLGSVARALCRMGSRPTIGIPLRLVVARRR